MVKVQKTDRKISPFGGINFVIDEIENAGIPALIDQALPKRRASAKYSFSDAILGLIYGVFCGAERLEDMANLKGMMHHSKLNIPSPDNLSIMFRHKLAKSSVTVGKHKVNIHAPLNALLVDVALKMGQLKAGKRVTLDYDNHIIPCEKYDAQFTYDKRQGYQPGVAFVGTTPVYIEGMNGNNPAAFDQPATLKRALDNLKTKGIDVFRFRADAASYQAESIELMDSNGIDFYIRALADTPMWDEITDICDWQTVTLAEDTFEIGSFEYVPLTSKGNTKSFRFVTTRRPADEIHKVTGEKYVYRSIATNNRIMSDLDVVWFYNQRGAIEKNFDALNNDWNWSCVPFSLMSENTVFLLVTAMGMVMYNALLDIFSKRADFVEPTFRLKAFRTHVVSVAAEWKGDTLLIHDNTKAWERLAG